MQFCPSKIVHVRVSWSWWSNDNITFLSVYSDELRVQYKDFLYFLKEFLVLSPPPPSSVKLLFFSRGKKKKILWWKESIADCQNIVRWFNFVSFFHKSTFKGTTIAKIDTLRIWPSIKGQYTQDIFANVVQHQDLKEIKVDYMAGVIFSSNFQLQTV